MNLIFSNFSTANKVSSFDKLIRQFKQLKSSPVRTFKFKFAYSNIEIQKISLDKMVVGKILIKM